MRSKEPASAAVVNVHSPCLAQRDRSKRTDRTIAATIGADECAILVSASKVQRCSA
jgi:hypothetical protein